MKTNISRDLQIGFGLSLLLVIASSVVSFLSIRDLLKNAALVNQSNNVIWKLESIISTMKDAETGQRGYLLSGDPVFLQPFNGTDTKVFSTLNEVNAYLTAKNGLQQQQLIALKKTLQTRFAQLNNLISLKRSGQNISNAQLKAGKVEMDALRQLINDLEIKEKSVLSSTTATQRFLNAFTPVIIVFATLLSLLIAVIYYFKLQKKYRENKELSEELEQKEATMAKRLVAIHDIASRISAGDYQIRITDEQKDDLGGVSIALNKMAASLSTAFTNLEANDWLQNGINGLNDKMLGGFKESYCSNT